MKVVLSRKGFDSGYGGWASPILPDGRMLSLPIPARDGVVSYDELSAGDGVSYLDIMRQLRRGHEDRLVLSHNTWLSSGPRITTHLDPDLVASSVERLPGWRGMFGQSSAANLFATVTQQLRDTEDSLNRADEYNHDHGTNMVNTFQIITDALRERQGASNSDALAYAAQQLRERGTSGSARLYAQNLQQAASSVRGTGLTPARTLELLQTLMGGEQERQAEQAEAQASASRGGLGGLLGSLLGAVQQQPVQQAAPSTQGGLGDLLGGLLGGQQQVQQPVQQTGGLSSLLGGPDGRAGTGATADHGRGRHPRHHLVAHGGGAGDRFERWPWNAGPGLHGRQRDLPVLSQGLILGHHQHGPAGHHGNDGKVVTGQRSACVARLVLGDAGQCKRS